MPVFVVSTGAGSLCKKPNWAGGIGERLRSFDDFYSKFFTSAGPVNATNMRDPKPWKPEPQMSPK